MSGIDKGRAPCDRQFKWLSIVRSPTKTIEAVERVRNVVERSRRLAILRAEPITRAHCPGFLLLEMRGVEHHQPRELARGAGGNDLSTKAALAQ